MKIVEFDDKGRRVEFEPDRAPPASRQSSALAPAPPRAAPPAVVAGKRRHRPDAIELYMFQTGTLKTRLKFIKMNQGESAYEIPVPWFLIRHPKGNVVIDGGNAAEVAIDKRAHWGAVLEAYDPVMGPSENCVAQLRMLDLAPQDIRYVLQSHLHLDHTGAVGRFPRATHVVQRIEYDYAFNPHWFAKGAYIRADFDRPGLNWKFLGGEYTDNFDLFGDGTVRMIFTPGHSPGHMSFLVTLPQTGPMLLTIDAAYTVDHWENRALPGLVTSSADAANSVEKLRRIAKDTGATVVTGHDPDSWKGFRKAPHDFYD